MILILNDIKFFNKQNLSFYKNRIYYNIDNIRINGLYIKIKKNMTENDDKYNIFLDKDFLIINGLIAEKYNKFINNIDNPNIKVCKNNITEKIYKNNEKYIILKIMSINNNNYPKIHILPWMDN